MRNVIRSLAVKRCFRVSPRLYPRQTDKVAKYRSALSHVSEKKRDAGIGKDAVSFQAARQSPGCMSTIHTAPRKWMLLYCTCLVLSPMARLTNFLKLRVARNASARSLFAAKAAE
jgi:hypothetical protein